MQMTSTVFGGPFGHCRTADLPFLEMAGMVYVAGGLRLDMTRMPETYSSSVSWWSGREGGRGRGRERGGEGGRGREGKEERGG